MITREIPAGERVADRYRVSRRLGSGGMATVWLAEDERLGREVAIKRLNTDAPEESLTRFRREARLGATLNHPNFVSVFDTIATDDGALIVMEYVPGKSLEDLQRLGPMDPAEVIVIVKQAAAALDHAHSHGVVHRDIKPANIMVRDDGTVKLADLGIARAVDATQITAEGKVIGTAPYMAPERFEAAGTGGPESDIYALAAVAYEMLSGAPLDVSPIRKGRPPERQALAERWPDLPESVLAVIVRGLSADPARRQLSAGEFASELEAAVRRGSRATAPFTPPATSTRRMPSRTAGADRERHSRTAPGLVLALIAILGLVVAGIALVGGGSGGSDGQKKKARVSKDRSASQGGAPAPAGSAAQPSAVADETPMPPASSSTPSGGASLNAEGYSLIQQGRYDEAVPVLRQAVASFPEGSTDLDYAYALYNLGTALRLSGHPEEAIPILERRLQIPNQQSTVAAELARARADAGTD